MAAKKKAADPLDIFDANYSSPTSILLTEWSDLMMTNTASQNAAFPLTITPERLAAGVDHRYYRAIHYHHSSMAMMYSDLLIVVLIEL
jgi:hypothetical protein